MPTIKIIDKKPGWVPFLLDNFETWDRGSLGIKIVQNGKIYGAWTRKRHPKPLILLALIPFIRKVPERSDPSPAF